jgi:adenosine deaminase
MKKFIQKIPKIELHAHLGGSIREKTIIELLKNNNLEHQKDLIQVLHNDKRTHDE